MSQKKSKGIRKKNTTQASNTKHSSNVIRYPNLQKHQIIVNPYSEEWLRKDFDRVYHQEILATGTQNKENFSIDDGLWVEILTTKGSSLGWGITAKNTHTNSEESIAIFRYFSTFVSENHRIEELRHRFHTCIKQRQSLQEHGNIYRLIHGGNDNFPGIRVDRFGHHICCTYASQGLLLLHDAICHWLSEYDFVHKIWKYVRDRAGNHIVCDDVFVVSKQEDTIEQNPRMSFVTSVHPDADIATENNLQYIVMPHRSPDAGVFCDMRDLRTWLKPYFFQRSFLNVFCFTGAFSVQALSCGATHVTSVDLSSTYLEWLQANIAINFPSENFSHFDIEQPNSQIHPFVRERHTSICSDAIKALDQFRRRNEKFDIVLADPPSFSHSSDGVWSVEGDLQKLVNACLRVVAPNGLFIIASNHGKLSPKEFSKAILQATRKVQRRCKIIHIYNPGIDVPAALHVPTGRYLKCWVLQCE